jgi:hypothetical protein
MLAFLGRLMTATAVMGTAVKIIPKNSQISTRLVTLLFIGWLFSSLLGLQRYGIEYPGLFKG